MNAAVYDVFVNVQLYFKMVCPRVCCLFQVQTWGTQSGKPVGMKTIESYSLEINGGFHTLKIKKYEHACLSRILPKTKFS